MGKFWTVASATLLSVIGAVAYAAAPALRFSADQAARGKELYAKQCAACHGSRLDNGEFGPSLKGRDVHWKWSGGSIGKLYATIRNRMPPMAPGSLSAEDATALTAYLLKENGFAPSAQAMPSDGALLAKISIPPPTFSGGGVVGDDVEVIPPPIAAKNPLNGYTPVTDAMIANPADSDWLTWRRNATVDGFSPLSQITSRNVDRLNLAWSWALPSGPNESTPLIHDGVLFVFGQGREDVVQALDAKTGDLLWYYAHNLSSQDSVNDKKSLALLGNRLFFASSDRKIVALDARNGTLIWETEILDRTAPEKRGRISGGPFIADGRVIVGTSGQQPGGNFAVALDPATGKILWRFATIPSPGADGGNSWNGLPLEARSGASLWTPGSYDPVSNIIFFGPAPTYNTGPLRDRISDPSVTNDALYTNNTIALDPATGLLRWHFSHRPNDQWDLDWAFERQILDIPVNGELRRVVVTGGKEAIFDLVDAKSGKFVSSFDLGLQNFVRSVDKTSGEKDIDPALIPANDRSILVCPGAEGGKNWLPNSLDVERKIMFVPLVESCQDFFPAEEGGGFLTTGVKIRIRPRPDSDGNFGRFDAIDLTSGKSLWSVRRRAVPTSGVLATAGGVVFAGYVDRNIIAYDSANGNELWRARLAGMPSSTIVTYAVDGKQYVAAITSSGGHHANVLSRLTPEIRNPVNAASTLWVFKLPEVRKQSGGEMDF